MANEPEPIGFDVDGAREWRGPSVALTRAMRWQLLVVAALAVGCDPGEPDTRDIEIRFRVTDAAGTPLSDVRPRCLADADSDQGDLTSPLVGTVAPIGGGDYLCSISGYAGGTVDLAVTDGAWFADRAVWPSDPSVPILVTWTPALTIEEVGDEIQVSWDVPPPHSSGWYATLEIGTNIGVDFDVGPDGYGASLPLAYFEDFADPTISVYAHQTHSANSLYAEQGTEEDIPVPHTPVVPASRGAACEVTELTSSTHGTEVAVVSHTAGDCPLTDGSREDAACTSTTSSDCEVVLATIDLGAELDVGWIIARNHYESTDDTIATSLDGVTYTDVEHADPSPTPVRARYVRVRSESALREISVFEASAALR